MKFPEDPYADSMNGATRLNPGAFRHCTTAPADIFEHPMFAHLIRAIDQALAGKGSRHGGGVIPFEQQKLFSIARSTGVRGIMFQVVKKASEACEKGNRKEFEREAIGAMVYLAAALIHVEKHGYTVDVPEKE